jgi:hypothetical protein
MQPKQQVDFTPDRLARLQQLSATLLSDSPRLPSQINLVDFVEYLYPAITALRECSYNWHEIHVMFHDHFVEFGFSDVSRKTFQNAYYRASNRICPRLPKRQRSLMARLNAGSRSPTILPSPGLTRSPLDHAPIVPIAGSPTPIAPPLPVTVAPQLVTKPNAVIAPPVATVTMASPEVAPTPPVELTEAELEVVLQLPNRFDAVAVQRFRQALHQLKQMDIPRWQKLYSAALNANINVTGGVVPDSARRNAMFNDY